MSSKHDDFLDKNWFKKRMTKSIDKAAVSYFKTLVDQQESITPATGKFYNGLSLINDTLTVVLNNGDIVSKPSATANDFLLVKNAQSEIEILTIMTSQEVALDVEKIKKETIKVKALQQGVQLLLDTKEFTSTNGSVYLKGVDRSIPQLLVEKFIEALGFVKDAKDTAANISLVDAEQDYLSLKKFWLKCCLNPNAQSAEDLYVFLAKHQFKIDKHGNFYAYRRVVSKDNVNKKLVEFVSNAYTKVKAIWKKSAKIYLVYESKQGYFISSTKVSDKLIGNLEELYLDLPNLQENSYTSAHTGKEDYRIGSVISMERQNGDDNNKISCSRGFHAASRAYDYSGFGNTPILVIINPIDVLAVPKGEDGKLRTCRWFFATILSEQEKYILDDDDYNVSELGDVFEEQCSTNLKDYVQLSFSQEVKRHSFTIPQISGREIDNIIDSLKQMKAKVAQRIVKV